MTTLIIFVVGAVVGSFLNVCILRLPKEESIAFPASHCPSCQGKIAWHDNIPILSFLMLGAKCRYCKKRISRQYLIIETVTGLLFVLFFHAFAFTPKGFLYLYLSLCLLVQAVIDMRYKIIPDEVTLPAIVIGLLVSTVFPQVHGQTTWTGGFLWSIVGILVGGGILYLAGTVAEWILKKEAMGGGDVKLLAAVGAVLGWESVLWTVFVSSLAGSVVGIYLRLRKNEETIPFGPFLALGAFLYMFVGPQTIHWYIHFLGQT